MPKLKVSLRRTANNNPQGEIAEYFRSSAEADIASFLQGICNVRNWHSKDIERAGDGSCYLHHMRIDHRGLQATMAQQQLNRPDIRSSCQ